MKKIILLVIVAAAVWYGYENRGTFFVQKPTTKTHYGTVTLFMDAALAKNASEMKLYCIGAAANSCDSVLSEIYSTNATFTRYQISMGGAAGKRISGQALCYGAQGDMFLSVLFTVEKQNDNWFISELATRSTK